MSGLLEARGVSVALGGRAALAGADLSVAAGELVGVLGPNGAGKTTLLRACLGLVGLSGGGVKLSGRDLGHLSAPERAALAAYLPQERRIAWSLPAWRIAALGAADRPASAQRAAALEALERVEMASLAERGVLEMSGGERARVLLARLLATRAPLLIADEPIAGLDAEAQLHALELLREEARAGRGVVVTLHDLGLAARFCDRLAVLHTGRIVVDAAPRDVLTGERLAEVFGLVGELTQTAAGPVLTASRLKRS